MANTLNVSPLTPEKIDALKSAHGHVAKITSKNKAAFVVARMPSVPEYQRATDKLHDSEQSKRAALEQLGKSVAVFPEGAELAAIFDAMPGLAYSVGDEALEMSGLGKAEVEKL